MLLTHWPAGAGESSWARLGPSKAQHLGRPPGPRNDGVRPSPSWGPVRRPGGSQSSPCLALVPTVLGPRHPWQSPSPWEDLVPTCSGTWHCRAGRPGPGSAGRHARRCQLRKRGPPASMQGPEAGASQADTHPTRLAGSAAWIPACGPLNPDSQWGRGDKAGFLQPCCLQRIQTAVAGRWCRAWEGAPGRPPPHTCWARLPSCQSAAGKLRVSLPLSQGRGWGAVQQAAAHPSQPTILTTG